MAVAVACLLGLAVTTGVLIWSKRRATPLVASGFAVLLGSAAGGLALWALGGATTLVMIVLPGALALGLVEAVLAARSVHWLLRLVVQGVLILGVLVVEWRRGDLFASAAAMAAVIGVLGFNVIVFGVGAAQLSDAPRVPALLGLLGSAYLVLVALGLPNPGLRGLALLVAAVTVPLVVLTPPASGFDRALGPMLGGLGLALAFLAWLGNASPAMVIAPVLPVVVDVIYTLIVRLSTRESRSGLSGRGWWKAIEAWASPGDDLVAQRAYASSKSMALVWFVGVTVVVLVLSLATWWVGVPWLVAQLLLLVPALGWLVLQAPWFQASQRNLLVGLGLVTLVGLAGTVLAWRQDGRVAMLILPLSLAAVVWATALLINRNTLLPAKMPG
ncbi:MAG: hypothetical protein R2703_04290 [Micropruina glycogenica]